MAVENFTLDVERKVTIPVEVSLDVERKVKDDRLKVWLPFDESTTLDKCGNEWTAYGSPTIADNRLVLNGSSYLQMTGAFAFTGQPFTISCKFSGTTKPSGAVALWQMYIGSSNRFHISIGANGILHLWKDTDSTIDITTSASVLDGQEHHVECDFDGSTWYLFLDGNLIGTKAHTCSSRTYKLYLGTNYSTGRKFTGTIDEFMIYDGVALHTENFTPPTAGDYFQLKLGLDGQAPLTLNLDTERRISNRVEVVLDVERKIGSKWRYVNMGDADDLILSSTILTDLPETQSKTGTAFYQTTRAKCFDLPTTDEVWLKFDVYFDGENRWRAYNGGSNGTTGITAQTTTELSFFSNDTNVQQLALGTVAKNQLQTVLLHMVSGSSAGIVEAWVDGTKIYTYTGDVNHGEYFADIYLQSDGAGTVFSNVIISNTEITFAEGYHTILFDVERRLKKSFEISLDVERNLIAPIVVPFIGEHFNHFVPSLKIFRDNPQKFILPKKSDVYIRGDLAGRVKFFSDTDTEGTSGTYAQLDECEVVFVKPETSALQVIRNFMQSLDETNLTGVAAVDEAVKFCTNGYFATKNALVEQLMNDLNNSASNVIFLQNYCDIILGNRDTGAITGWDAGGGSAKTAESVVPETIPVENWVLPELGSSKVIEGLTVHFPTKGMSKKLSNVEKYLLAGLNSVWIEQSLKLIQTSFGMNFNESGTTIKEIDVEFENKSSAAIAHVQAESSGDNVTGLKLYLNKKYYASGNLDMTSVDGTFTDIGEKLDRIIAHELTHAVMAANVNNISEMPLYIMEGMAELVHGADDTRIKNLLGGTSSSSDKRILQGILTDATVATGDSSEYNYLAGYIFLRYLAKQAQAFIPVPSQWEINNLIISDGEIDFYGDALTDNTRQNFQLDVLRTLARKASINLDVEILSVIPVEFSLDVKRALLAKLFLYPKNSEDFFNDENNPFVINGTKSLRSKSRLAKNSLRAATTPPANTQGLQSLSVTLAEQQITDQVKFTGVIPFDIMQQVSGQYLDYNYNMRVERVQQQGILYTCDCCSDLDQLLYTQINYQLDSGFAYFLPDYENMTLVPVENPGEIDWENLTPEYQGLRKGKASAHLQTIAAALGKNLICQFEDFISTMDEKQSDVTYGDLISQLFGWTSRLPHRQVNVFIRAGTLFAIQRGQEANLINISAADKTSPTINRELIRTMFGSGKFGITPNTQTEHIDNTRLVGGHKDYPWPPTMSPDGKTIYNYHNVSGYGDIDHGYALTSTVTFNDDGSQHQVDYHYAFVEGVYTCTMEVATDLDENGEKIAEQITHHDRLTPSQQFSYVEDEDGTTTSSNVGSNLPGFYAECYTLRLPNKVGEEGDVSRFVGYNPLIDINFPVLDPVVYPKLIEDYAWLNHRTKETVTLSIYNLAHLIDFNDRIILDGNEYFLQNNTVQFTTRREFEQNLTLVRWY